MHDATAQTAISQLSAYLSLGWALVPLHGVRDDPVDPGCTCRAGRECASAGKHPRYEKWGEDGQLVKSVSVASSIVRAMPEGNWGVATGEPSGVWVLDIDAAGETEFVRWCVEHGDEWTRTLTAVTGSAGRHFYFVAPDDGVMPRNISKRQRREGRVPPGIDVRGTGGQAVLPPSVSRKGAYAWLNWGAPILQAPAWLLALVREENVETAPDGSEAKGWRNSIVSEPSGAGASFPGEVTSRGPAYARAAVERELAELRAAPVGTRNDTAFAVACRLIELINAPWADLDRDDTVFAQWWNAASAHPDGERVPASELEHVWQSAARKVGDGAAELPESWMDGEVIPFLSAPWASSSGWTGSTASAGSVQGADLATRGLSIESVGNSPAAGQALLDPAEQAVLVEMQRQWVREEARRRLAASAGGTLLERVAAMRARLLDRVGLLALPAPAWLVPDVLQRDTLARIVGQPGHGKSFVALDLAAALGSGLDWGGRTPGTAAAGEVVTGRVLYVVGEAIAENAARVRAWEAAHGRELTDVTFYPEPVQAGDPAAWDALVVLAGELAPDLIVIDTQARMSVGVNENDPTDMGRFVEACERLRAASGACVLLVHHTPLGAERARGTGAVLGAMHSEILCRKEGRTVELRVIKQKGAPDGDDGPKDLVFELRTVHGASVGTDGFVDPDGAIGAALHWVGAEHRVRRVPRPDMTDEKLIGYAGQMAGVAAEVLNLPASRATREQFMALCKEYGIEPSRSAYYKAFAVLLERRVIAQIRGTTSYRYVPQDERETLVSPRSADGSDSAGFWVE
jgi:hypothetical protein